MVNLGDEVKDVITGFQGIAVGVITYINGCRRIGIQTAEFKNGRPQDIYWIDEPQIEVVTAMKITLPITENGGPLDLNLPIQGSI